MPLTDCFPLRLATLLFVASALMGCGGISGNWQSREKLSNGKRNTLFVDLDDSAELKMYVALGPDQGLSRLLFKGDTSVDDNGDFDFELRCDGGCDQAVAAGFDMECSHDSALDFLDCKAKSPFSDYGYFEFEAFSE